MRLNASALRQNAGATLVDVAIVLFFVAAASLLAVPWLQSRQLVANETEAKSILREIAAAETVFFAKHGGAFGLLPELCGDTVRREVPVETRSLADVAFERQGSLLRRKGYLFSVHLPRPEALKAASRTSAGGDAPAFIAYAWPINVGYSGRRVFVVDETGAVRSWANERGREAQGYGDPPAPGAAPHPRGLFGEPPLIMQNAVWELVVD